MITKIESIKYYNILKKDLKLIQFYMLQLNNYLVIILQPDILFY